MRLRLNTTLRAALIAAITAVGFTLSQAQAADVVLSNIMLNTSQSGNITATVWGDSSSPLTLTEPSAAYSITQGSTTLGSTTYSQSIVAVPTNVGSGGKYDFTLTFSVGAADGVTVDKIVVDMFSLNSGGNTQNSGYRDCSVTYSIDCGEQTKVNSTTSTVTLTGAGTGSAVGTVPAYTLNDGVYTPAPIGQGNGSVSGGPLTIDLSTAPLTLNSGDTYTLHMSVQRVSTDGFFTGIGNIALINTVADPTSTWIGGEGHTTWSDSEAWNGDVPTEGTVAVFDANGTGTTVTISSAAQALSVNVSDKEYTFNLSEGSSLTTDTLTVTSDGSLALAGTGTMSVTEAVTVETGGSLSVSEGTTLKVSNAASAKALMMSEAVTNNGTFELATDVTLDAGATTKMGGALKVDSGVTLKLSSNKTNPTSIESFSSVELAGGNLWANTTMRTIKALAVTDNSQISFADFPDAYASNPTVFDGVTRINEGKTLTVYTEYKSSIQMNQLTGAGTLKLTTANRDDNGANVTIVSLTGFTGSLNLAPGNANNPVRVTAALGDENVSMGTLSLSGNSGAASAAKHTFFKLTGEHNLTLKGIDGTNGEVSLTVPSLTLDVAGTYSYTGALAISGNIVKTGEGSQTIGALNLHSALEVQKGTLALNGVTQTTGASISVGSTGTLTLGGTVTFADNTAISVTQGGTVNWDSAVVFDLDGLQAQSDSGKYVYTLFSGADVDLSTLSTTNITMTGGTVGKQWTFNSNGTISYTAAAQKVWTGGYFAEWNNTDANWNGSTFENGDSALFNDDAGVMVAPGISASQIEVAAGGKQVILAPSVDGTLSSATVIIGDGSELVAGMSLDGVTNFSVGTESLWTILEDVTQNLGAGTNSGTIYLNAGATARLTDASNSKDLLVGIEGTGDIELAVNTNVEGGTSEASKVSSKATGKLIIDQGVTLSVGRPAISGAFQQRYVDLSSFSAVDLNGGKLQVHMNNLVLKNLTVGTANSSLNILDTAGANSPALTLQGTTTLNKDLTLTSNWKHQLVIEKLAGTGTLNLNGSDNSVVNIGTAGGDSGTVGKISVQSDASNVTINGTLNITGDLETKKGTTNIAGNVTVGTNLDLSSGGASTGSLVVKSDAVLTTAGMWGTSSTQLDVEEGGTVNLAGMQIVGGEGGAVISTTAENEQYGISKGTWAIINADITATANISIGNMLSMSTINTRAYDVTLTNGDNWLLGATVGDEGSLSMAGGNLDGVITSEGTVTFTGALAVEGFEEQEGAEGRMDVNGTFTEGANGNGYEAKAANYITIVDGGDVVADNIAVTQGEDEAAVTYYLNNSGDALREDSGGVTDYGTYYLTRDRVAVSALNEATTVIDVTGGTVDVDSEYTGDIMVSGEGTITGEHATPSQVGIAVGSTANFVDGVADTTNGVYYENDSDAPVTVENTGEATIHFSIAKADAKVTADNIVSDSEVEVQVDNQVVVNTIATYGNGTLILSQVDTDTLANIYADMGGSVTLKNVTNATLENLAMNNNTVAVYTDGTSTTEGTVTITDTLIAGQGTLLANLTLVDDSTLDLSLVGGGMQALTLGSKLTFDLQDGLVNLDQDTIAALDRLSEGQWLDLIVAADQTTLNYGGAYEGVSYDTLFSATGLTGPYTVYAHDNAFGLVRGSNVPEPTTGTLSLLALAALAARRRRK